MRPYEHEPRDPRSRAIRVVIDTPAGSRNKYKYDEDTGLFCVSRVLPAGMQFPHDFGSIPGTCAQDGDPLDVLVLGVAPTFPGCLVTVRLIGVLRAIQIERRRKVRNDRLIGVAITPVNRPAIAELSAIDREHLRDIEQFFVSYNRVHGREFSVTGRSGSRAAAVALARAERRHADSRETQQ